MKNLKPISYTAISISSEDPKLSLLAEFIQNVTIEERVALLEIQVIDLDQDVNFLFDEQITQDQGLFSLEQETGETYEQLIVVDDDLESKFVKVMLAST